MYGGKRLCDFTRIASFATIEVFLSDTSAQNFLFDTIPLVRCPPNNQEGFSLGTNSTKRPDTPIII